MAPDPSRRSERARQAVLIAATDLVTETGYAKLTVEAIAARAGVGKQTIYRWWPSKGAVVFDAFLDLSALPDFLVDSGNIALDLKLMMRTMARRLGDPGISSLHRALIGESQSDRELASDMDERLIRPWLELTMERLRGAQRDGQITDDVDLAVAVELIFAPINHRWLFRTAPITEAYADLVVDLALRALRPTR
jgi:AcrR family transcriptional regulator